jgi:nucleotide-binding universal stress UspA family protein
MYKRILLAYDGSLAGQQALLDCHEIAQWSQSEVALVAVAPSTVTAVGPEGGIYDESLQRDMEKRYRGILDAGLAKLAESGMAAKGEVLTGDPVLEVARFAGRIKADLIVLGHKHLDGWAARWWRGSVSKSLIEHALCSVLVVITK